MSCEEIENRILEYQENRLSPGQRAEVETHLAGCADCRVFARQLQQLDAALSASVNVPALSADFDRHLHERIQCAPAILSESERAARERQLQTEYEAGRARIERDSFAWNNWLTHLAWPVLAILGGWLTWKFTLAITVHLNARSLDGFDPNLLPLIAGSMVFLTVALAEVFEQPRKFLGLR